jgi:hypothetical protein
MFYTSCNENSRGGNVYKRIIQKIKDNDKEIIIATMYTALLGTLAYAAVQHQRRIEAYNLAATMLANADAGFVPKIDWDNRMMTFVKPE